MPELRDYQERTIDLTIKELYKGNNPCIVAPTGAGKSWMIAGLIRECIERFPDVDTRILMLTHQKELIEQDVSALTAFYPSVDVGVYSASIGKKELDHKVIYASVQSLSRCKNDLSNRWHLVIIDEAHKVNAEGGMYKKLFEAIKPIFIIGFTATPFRLGQGYLDKGDKTVFTTLVNSISISELQSMGKLAYMKSRGSKLEISMDGVKTVNGDYDKEEMNKRVDTFKNNEEITTELLKDISFFGLKHMLIFSPTVNHSKEIADMMTEKSEGKHLFRVIHGGLSKEERETLIQLFRDGNITGLVNCEVLTTGFDYPDIDSVVMLRPTQSTALYAQMVGRGLRPKTTKGGKYGGGDCYLFDFVGNVKRHGVITDINFLDVECGLGRSAKKNDGPPEEKVKCCPHCLAFIPAGRNPICPECGTYLKDIKLETGNVNDGDKKEDPTDKTPNTYRIKSWAWSLKKTKKGDDCAVVYYFTDTVMLMEWMNIYSSNEKTRNFSRKRIMDVLGFIPRKEDVKNIHRFAHHPRLAEATKEGQYWKIHKLVW